jgi:hypothetical protein
MTPYNFIMILQLAEERPKTDLLLLQKLNPQFISPRTEISGGS